MKVRNVPKAVLALSLVLRIMPAHAAEGEISESNFLGELPIVLSASRLSQPTRDAPGAVTVIDRDMIRASGARSIPELLRLVPGFQVGAINGHQAVTTYHGLADNAPRRMLVRVDGRSAYAPYVTSGIEWQKLSVDIDDIDRIEVFRGTNTVAYGSQAFMGTVNIITRTAAETPRMRLRIDQGENGIQDRNVSLGYATDVLAMRLNAGQEQDRGRPGLADSHRRQKAELRTELQLALNQRLELQAGTIRLREQIGYSEPATTDPVRTQRSEVSFGQIRWNWQQDGGDELSITYSHQEESTRDAYTLTAADVPLLGLFPPLAHVDIIYDNDITRDDIELEDTVSLTHGIRGLWGMGYREDRVLSPGIFARNDALSYRSTRLFGNLEWRITPDLLANIGAMAERSGTDDSQISPRIGLNYHLGSGQTLRVAAGKAYRNPVPFERYADMRFSEAVTNTLLRHTFQPAPDVEAERMRFRELGYLGEFSAIRTSIDLRLFEERTDGLIEFESTDSPLSSSLEAGQAKNLGRATVRGAELAVLWRPSARTWLGVNYSRIDIDSANDRYVRSAPRASWSVLAAWSPSPRWTLSANHHRTGSMSWYRSASDQLPAHYRTDIRLAYRFQLGPTRNELAVTVSDAGPHDADYLPDQKSGPVSHASLRVEF
ncbi:MAG: hypothetical protein CVU19_10545 [Betaproteobacteria bacterium HGW-Betaproteobacteria-13]|jgi:iron complex outermembrane receptor protein|nr:MAG: hypothetical protein CVU19_10545 [Betaproteobacteria bacterium HGW-Betaproteobacteria-13]